MTSLVYFIGITPKASPETPIVPPPTMDVDPPPSPAELAPVLSALNEHLTKLHRALPTRTAFVIFTGHSDPRKMAMLNMKKTAFETAYRNGTSLTEMTEEKGLSWTAADARNLEEAVELARRGLLFLGIKQ
jgi:RNA exonuclease 1